MKSLFSFLFGEVSRVEARHIEIFPAQKPLEYYEWEYQLQLPVKR